MVIQRRLKRSTFMVQLTQAFSSTYLTNPLIELRSTGPWIGLRGFVYRRCYCYRSCAFQRFIIHCLFRGYYNIMNRLLCKKKKLYQIHFQSHRCAQIKYLVALLRILGACAPKLGALWSPDLSYLIFLSPPPSHHLSSSLHSSHLSLSLPASFSLHLSSPCVSISLSSTSLVFYLLPPPPLPPSMYSSHSTTLLLSPSLSHVG